MLLTPKRSDIQYSTTPQQLPSKEQISKGLIVYLHHLLTQKISPYEQLKIKIMVEHHYKIKNEKKEANFL